MINSTATLYATETYVKSFKRLLYKLGWLHETNSKSEHIASYVTNGSLLALFALIPIAVIDEFILNRLLHEYLAVIGKLSLCGFGLGCILIILATNKII